MTRPAKSLPTKIAVSSAEYDHARRMLTVKGWALWSNNRPKLRLTTSVGRVLATPVFDIVRHDLMSNFPEYGFNACGWALEQAIPNLVDGEKIIADTGIKITQVEKPISMVNTPTIHQPNRALDNDLFFPDADLPRVSSFEVDYVAARLEAIGPSTEPRENISPSAVYFPLFDDEAALTDHYHRARWYLPRTPGVVERVGFHCRMPLQVGPKPAHMCDVAAEPSHIEVVSNTLGYIEALRDARAVLVWRPIDEDELAKLRRILPHARIATVATEDINSIEYGNYCRLLWIIQDDAERKARVERSHRRFLEIGKAIEAKNYTAAAVFGTGPSLDTAFEYDFSKTLTVACNTIVASERLLDHIAPTFICAGDVVSHFGVSTYAHRFREDLARALRTRDANLLTTAPFGFLFVSHYPDLVDRVLLCEQRTNGASLDLREIWSLPKLDSTLNIHMLPIVTSFCDDIFVLGCDGQDPDPAKREDFWAHSRLAHYHDLVDTGHLCHPAFDRRRALFTHSRFIDSTEESFAAGERVGKRYFSLRLSHTAALKRRPAPSWALKPSAAKLPAPTPPAPPRNARSEQRVLIVTRAHPRLFSGGRYHALMIGEALASLGHPVTVWCDNVPSFVGDLTGNESHSLIRFQVGNFLSPPAGAFDYVFIIPDSSSDPTPYIAALRKAKESKARTILVNFETPNWFNRYAPVPRPEKQWDNWLRAAEYVDVVLSSAEVSRTFALEFFDRLKNRPLHLVAYPSINSTAADAVRARRIPQTDQIISLSRFGSAARHKNIEALTSVLPKNAQGYTLALIVGTGNLPDEAELREIENSVAAYGLKLKLLHNISDIEKFEEIAKSRLMIFPSLFEGFGYPPVEALYMNRPCVVYDLPVLREVSGDRLVYAKYDDASDLRKKAASCINRSLSDRLLGNGKRKRTPEERKAFNRVFSIAGFATRLDGVLQAIAEAGRPPAAAQFPSRRAEDLWRRPLAGTEATQVTPAATPTPALPGPKAAEVATPVQQPSFLGRLMAGSGATSARGTDAETLKNLLSASLSASAADATAARDLWRQLLLHLLANWPQTATADELASEIRGAIDKTQGAGRLRVYARIVRDPSVLKAVATDVIGEEHKKSRRGAAVVEELMSHIVRLWPKFARADRLPYALSDSIGKLSPDLAEKVFDEWGHDPENARRLARTLLQPSATLRNTLRDMTDDELHGLFALMVKQRPNSVAATLAADDVLLGAFVEALSYRPKLVRDLETRLDASTVTEDLETRIGADTAAE